MTTDAQAAASSPAPTAAPITAADQAVATHDVAAYKAARLAERSGKPAPASADQSAATAAATPVDQAASTDATSTPAASEPAKGKGAKARSAELDAEVTQLREKLKLRAELRAELDRLDRREPPKPQDAQPAVSSPAKAPEKFPDYAAYLEAHPDAPLEQWLDARDEWRDTQRATKARADADAQHRTTAQQQRTEKVRGQIAKKVEADPEFLAKVKPEILDLKPFDALAPGEPAGPLNAIAEEILDSPVMPELLLHFSEHPEDLARLAELRDPRALVREFGKLEARLDTTAATPSPATPHPKTITDAPAPPTTLGSRPSEALDPVTAAVVSGDQAAFKAAKLTQRRAAVR